MPYITQKQRQEIDNCLEGIEHYAPDDAEELNYLITKLIHNFLDINGLDYTKLNETVGAPECCKMELYRRIGIPYEDIKLLTNGGV